MSNSGYHPPSEKTHFLVSGGGKGITALNAVALAEEYQSRFTLIGRSPVLKKEPSWASGLIDESDLKGAALDYHREQKLEVSPREIGREVNKVLSSREILDTLDKISRSGGKAEYIQVDITDPDDLNAKLESRISSINALLHGAGALADKYIEEKTESDFDLVYGVKIGGLKNILELIPVKQFDFLILFSSVAGFYGNAGQADYSISNEILNKLAHHLKLAQPECQVLSIGWGPWDGGMVTPQLKRILARRNVPLISPEAGTRALVGLLANFQDNPQHVIGDPLPVPPQNFPRDLKTYRITRQLSLEENPFLVDHVIGGNAVLPTVCAVAWFINSCQALYPGFHFYGIKDYQVFKGIVFESGSPSEYLLELKELEKDPEILVFEGKISSQTADAKKRFHYQARVELRKTLPPRPVLDGFDLRAGSRIDGESLYSSKILFHGIRFHGIREVINIDSKGLTTRCRLDQFPAEDLGQFPIREFNPYLADVHLQSLLIWAHHQQGILGLPLQIAGGIQYQSIPDGEVSYATMKMKKITPHKLVADVISHDENGLVYSEVIDAEITLNEKLYELFKQNHLENEPVWI